MTVTTPNNKLTLALLFAIGILVIIVAIEWYLINQESPLDYSDVAGEDVTLPTADDFRYHTPDINDFPQVLERPVFFPDRTLPAEAEPQAVTAAPLLPLRLTLEGVAISADSRVAVLRSIDSNQQVNLAEGMSHDGWTLESISPDRAVFRRGPQVSELLLDDDSNNTAR